MRGALGRPLKPRFVQLPSLPNRERLLSEFRRCAPTADLINLELERFTILSAGPSIQLSAFIKNPALTINHVIYGAKINEEDLLKGCRILAQTAERETIKRRRAAAEKKEEVNGGSI